MRPARKRDKPAWSSMIAVARVVQKARSPVVKLMKKRMAAARSTATAVTARRPGVAGSRTAGQIAAARSHTTRITLAVRAL